MQVFQNGSFSPQTPAKLRICRSRSLSLSLYCWGASRFTGSMNTLQPWGTHGYGCTMMHRSRAKGQWGPGQKNMLVMLWHWTQVVTHPLGSQEWGCSGESIPLIKKCKIFEEEKLHSGAIKHGIKHLSSVWILLVTDWVTSTECLLLAYHIILLACSAFGTFSCY